jgi:hypothetical protein
MHAHPGQTLFLSPFMAWSRLMTTTGEMFVASAQVISHRTLRMALASPAPSERDQREFALMGREKAEVALESARAAGLQLQTIGQQFAMLAFKQMMSTSASLMSIAASRNPTQTVALQSKLLRDSVNNTVTTAAKLSGSSARIAQHALHPVRKRVSKNAVRLRKSTVSGK